MLTSLPRMPAAAVRAGIALLCCLVAVTALVALGSRAEAALDEPFVATDIATGDGWTCALLVDDTVKCWGADQAGGFGGVGPSSLPVTVAGLTDVQDVTAGCAIVSDFSVRCWGANDRGQLGDGTTTDSATPVSVTGFTALDVSRSDTHACAVLFNAKVRCWGANDQGQLGDGTTTDSSVPVEVTGISFAYRVSAGDGHTCVATHLAEVWCWGGGVATPFRIGPISTEHVATGAQHACAIDDGFVDCWGQNQYGELGNGTNSFSVTSVMVSGLSDAVQVSAGGSTTCAVRSDGTAWCWGRNDHGQLGNGTTTHSNVPVQVQLTGVAKVAVGPVSVCALLESGGVRCWGSGADGALGNGAPFDSSLPVRLENHTAHPVVGVSGVDTLTVGSRHSCTLDGAGSVRCWGDNLAGQRGGGASSPSYQAVTVSGLTQPQSLASGANHTCAVLADTTLRCWGENAFGQLGTGSYSGSSTPVTVSGLTGVTQVDGSPWHTCATLSDATARCWGYNGDGQLGVDGLFESLTPVSPTGLAGVSQITTGQGHTCALLATGHISCWGNNFFGQLGNNSQQASSSPVEVIGLIGATQIAAGRDHTCAVRADGTVWCWGANADGRIGDGSTTDRLYPRQVPGIEDAVAVSAGWWHSCALSSDGTVRCWGDNSLGQLGDGTRTSSPAPVVVSGVGSATALAVDQTHGCVVLTGGSVECWGDNSTGQLGTILALPPLPPPTPTPTPTSTPTPTPTATPTPSPTPTPTPPPSPVFVPIDPVRLMDTRGSWEGGGATVDGRYQGAAGRPDDNRVEIAGRGGVPQDARAIVANLTVVHSTDRSYLTLFPCAAGLPPTASLNFLPGPPNSNDVVVGVGAERKACWDTPAADYNIVLDAMAYVPAGSPYQVLSPQRLLDTRAGVGRNPGTHTLQITGRAGIPGDVTAVVLNVTAVAPGANGFLTVHPCLDQVPLASALNYATNLTRGNEIIAPVSAQGTVCLYRSQRTDLTVDVVGYIPTGTAYHPVAPARLMDTRLGGATVDDLHEADGKMEAHETRVLPVAGRAGVHAGAELAVLNVSAVRPPARGFITVWDCTDPRPGTASASFIADAVTGTEILTKLSPEGNACVYTHSATELVIDVNGYHD